MKMNILKLSSDSDQIANFDDVVFSQLSLDQLGNISADGYAGVSPNKLVLTVSHYSIFLIVVLIVIKIDKQLRTRFRK